MKNIRNLPFVSWAFVCVLLVAALVILPLSTRGFFVSDDGDWMIIRLSAFFQSLREGQFPVRFLGRLNYGYGYPVANFLYPGFLYIGSIIHLFGFSFVDSTKIILAGSVVGASVCIFLWLRRHFHIWASFLGAAGFILSPYLFFDIYTRGSVGEVVAFFAAALTLLVFDSQMLAFLPFAVGFLLTSHNSLALLFLLLICFYGVFTGKGKMWPYILLGIGMASFFWLPALFDKRFVVFDMQTIANPSIYLIGINNSTLLNIVPAIAGCLYWQKRKIIRGRETQFFVGVFLVGVFMAIPLSLPLWNTSLLVTLFQFPYRFLALGLIAGPWLIAQAYETIVRKERRNWIVLWMILWAVPLGIGYRNIRWIIQPEGYYTTNEATTTVADEYMPKWVITKPQMRSPARVEFFQGRGAITVNTFSSHKIMAVIDAKEKSVIQINTIYYPGWGIEVDGQPVLVDYHNGMGVMRVEVPQGMHKISVEFRETVFRFIADSISLISVIVGFCLFFVRRNRLAG
ncbi:hypothetical protein HY948_04430 [Candidatus Gottesmanbacteria bacterium]|nr:hypothetical protein [Candidatus Gottesmanbacteria bacterium]